MRYNPTCVIGVAKRRRDDDEQGVLPVSCTQKERNSGGMRTAYRCPLTRYFPGISYFQISGLRERFVPERASSVECLRKNPASVKSNVGCHHTVGNVASGDTDVARLCIGTIHAKNTMSSQIMVLLVIYHSTLFSIAPSLNWAYIDIGVSLTHHTLQSH